MREIQLDNFKDAVKLPDRVATFTLEAPQLMALDPENEESIIQFEKRKRAEVARKASTFSSSLSAWTASATNWRASMISSAKRWRDSSSAFTWVLISVNLVASTER